MSDMSDISSDTGQDEPDFSYLHTFQDQIEGVSDFLSPEQYLAHYKYLRMLSRDWRIPFNLKASKELKVAPSQKIPMAPLNYKTLLRDLQNEKNLENLPTLIKIIFNFLKTGQLYKASKLFLMIYDSKPPDSTPPESKIPLRDLILKKFPNFYMLFLLYFLGDKNAFDQDATAYPKFRDTFNFKIQPENLLSFDYLQTVIADDFDSKINDEGEPSSVRYRNFFDFNCVDQEIYKIDISSETVYTTEDGTKFLYKISDESTSRVFVNLVCLMIFHLNRLNLKHSKESGSSNSNGASDSPGSLQTDYYINYSIQLAKLLYNQIHSWYGRKYLTSDFYVDKTYGYDNYLNPYPHKFEETRHKKEKSYKKTYTTSLGMRYFLLINHKVRELLILGGNFFQPFQVQKPAQVPVKLIHYSVLNYIIEFIMTFKTKTCIPETYSEIFEKITNQFGPTSTYYFISPIFLYHVKTMYQFDCNTAYRDNYELSYTIFKHFANVTKKPSKIKDFQQLKPSDLEKFIDPMTKKINKPKISFSAQCPLKAYYYLIEFFLVYDAQIDQTLDCFGKINDSTYQNHCHLTTFLIKTLLKIPVPEPINSPGQESDQKSSVEKFSRKVKRILKKYADQKYVDNLNYGNITPMLITHQKKYHVQNYTVTDSFLNDQHKVQNIDQHVAILDHQKFSSD